MTEREPMPGWQTVDRAKLEQALAAPAQTFGGNDLYADMADKAAIFLYTMVKNHAWENGNKRMGFIATLVFLAKNGRWWEATGEEMRAHVTWIAASEARLFNTVMDYLKGYFRLRMIEIEPATAEDLSL
jgi:death-on-curing family protein